MLRWTLTKKLFQFFSRGLIQVLLYLSLLWALPLLGKPPILKYFFKCYHVLLFWCVLQAVHQTLFSLLSFLNKQSFKWPPCGESWGFQVLVGRPAEVISKHALTVASKMASDLRRARLSHKDYRNSRWFLKKTQRTETVKATGPLLFSAMLIIFSWISVRTIEFFFHTSMWKKKYLTYFCIQHRTIAYLESFWRQWLR